MKEVVVMGGGVIGLCSAYFLLKSGHRVSVVDQSSMDFGASYVNAGYISPSHIMPLASPGVVRQGLKWMFDTTSPLYIKFRWDREFLNWLWAFNKSCSKANVAKSMGAIKDIAVLSRDLFAQIKQEEGFDFHMEQRGLMVLCQTEAMLEKEKKLVALSQEQGLEAEVLTEDGIQKMEPNREVNVLGGSLYRCDWHSTPHEFMKELKAYLKSRGVKFYPNERIHAIDLNGGAIQKIHGEHASFEGDEFVLATGSWSQGLAKKLGITLRLQAGKGYRINLHRDTGIGMPAILAENKVAVTPMNGFTRFAGTMEIAGVNHLIRKERVTAIANSVATYYPGLSIDQEALEDAACGLRPLSPDGRPYIGKSTLCKNVVFATGHAMMGWSMAPGTGKLVAEIIEGSAPSIPIEAFHPDRKFG